MKEDIKPDKVILEIIEYQNKLKTKTDIMFFMIILLGVVIIWLVNLLYRLGVI